MGTPVGRGQVDAASEQEMDPLMMSFAAPICLAALASMVTAADGQLAADPPTLRVPHAAVAPRVDADPDDPAWSRAATIPRLAASVKENRRSARGDSDADGDEPLTEVRLLWRPDALHVRFICEDDEPYAPYGVERDALHHEGDVVEVFIDGVGDGRQWFEVQLNPVGGILDQNTTLAANPVSDERGLLTRASNRTRSDDLAYRMEGLRTAVRPVEDGWIADLAIPASAVLGRLPERRLEPGTELCVNLLRYDRPMRDDGTRGLFALNWSPILEGNPHRSPQRMGTVIMESADPPTE